MTTICESLLEPLRSICEGTSRRSNGECFTTAERASVVAFKLHRKVEPSELPVVEECDRPKSQPSRKKAGRTRSLPKREQPRRIVSSDIGNRLHRIIASETGQAVPCGECKAAIEQLNRWTPHEVLRDSAAIAAGIADRAKYKAPRFWQRWGATLAPGMAQAKARGWVIEATGLEPGPVAHIVVSVRTCARKVPTLAKTLESLAEAGFDRPILFGEPDAPDQVDVRWPERMGSVQSFIAHARWLLDNTAAGWFLLCEDDVLLARGLHDKLRTFRYGDEVMGLTTLFKPAGRTLRGDAEIVDAQSISGSLAVLVRRRELLQVLESTAVKKWPKKDEVDYMLTAAARELKLPIRSPSRSWVEHIGTTSACQPGRWEREGWHDWRHAGDFVEAVG